MCCCSCCCCTKGCCCTGCCVGGCTPMLVAPDGVEPESSATAVVKGNKALSATADLPSSCSSLAATADVGCAALLETTAKLLACCAARRALCFAWSASLEGEHLRGRCCWRPAGMPCWVLPAAADADLHAVAQEFRVVSNRYWLLPAQSMVQECLEITLFNCRC